MALPGGRFLMSVLICSADGEDHQLMRWMGHKDWCEEKGQLWSKEGEQKPGTVPAS